MLLNYSISEKSKALSQITDNMKIISISMMIYS